MVSLILFTNERDSPSVEEQPLVKLRAWRVFKSAQGNFFIGAELGGGAIRLTSPLLRMDFVAGVAVTSSGRQYEFSGPPTVDQAAHQLITANALRRGLHGAADVSELWWQALMHGLDGLTQEALASVLIPARGAAPDTVPGMDQDRPSSPG